MSLKHKTTILLLCSPSAPYWRKVVSLNDVLHLYLDSMTIKTLIYPSIRKCHKGVPCKPGQQCCTKNQTYQNVISTHLSLVIVRCNIVCSQHRCQANFNMYGEKNLDLDGGTMEHTYIVSSLIKTKSASASGK